MSQAAGLRRASHSFQYNPFRAASVFYVLVALVCAIVVFPVYWMIVSAIQPARLSMRYPPPFFPQAISLTPFQQLFRDYPVITWVTNSTVISILSTARAGAGYFRRVHAVVPAWRGATVRDCLVLHPDAARGADGHSDFHHPPAAAMLENLPAVSLVNAAFVLPIGIWILKGSIRCSATRDSRGCAGRRLRCDECAVAHRRAAVAARARRGRRRGLLLRLERVSVHVHHADHRPGTASIGRSRIAPLDDGDSVERILAASMLFSAPPVVFYLLMQRYIVSGLTAGAVKG